MAVIEGATSGVLVDVGAAVSAPLHTVDKPTPALGHYSVSMVSGVMAAGLAAGSDIYQFRWTDATRLCSVVEIALEGIYQLTAFTAGAGLFRVGIARTWTAPGTGGNTAVLTGNNNKLRTSMGTSLLGEIRCASTAALGTGTKTYDSQDIVSYPKMILASGNTQITEPLTLFSREPSSEHP